MKLVAVLCGLMFASSAFASVAPYWDRVTQIQTVLQSEELATALGGQPIENIASPNRNYPLTFLVITAQCMTSVTLEIHTTENPGPASYTVKAIEAPTCN